MIPWVSGTSLWRRSWNLPFDPASISVRLWWLHSVDVLLLEEVGVPWQYRAKPVSLVVFGVAILIYVVWRRVVTVAGVACVTHCVWLCFTTLCWWVAYMDNNWRGLQSLSGSEVMTDDLEVLDIWMQNQQLLVIMFLLNLWEIGSDYLGLGFIRPYIATTFLLW